MRFRFATCLRSSDGGTPLIEAVHVRPSTMAVRKPVQFMSEDVQHQSVNHTHLPSNSMVLLAFSLFVTLENALIELSFVLSNFVRAATNCSFQAAMRQASSLGRPSVDCVRCANCGSVAESAIVFSSKLIASASSAPNCLPRMLPSDGGTEATTTQLETVLPSSSIPRLACWSSK